MNEPLTPLERRVYHYLIDFLAENTYQPSIRDIAKKFRIKSTKTVSDLLQALASKGYIQREESRSRGVRIVGLAAVGSTQPVPVVLMAPPTNGQDGHKRHVTIDRRFLPSDHVFFVRAPDQAMSGNGILAGDYVLVSPSSR